MQDETQVESSPTETTEEMDNPTLEGEASPEVSEETLEVTEETPEEVNTQEDSNVPLSRFKDVYGKMKEYREKSSRIDELEKKLENIINQSSQKDMPTDEDVFGDNEDGQQLKGWFENKIQSIEQQAVDKALEKLMSVINETEHSTEKSVNEYNEKLLDIEIEHNVKLTGESPQALKNRNEILDIIEEYSDEGAIFPMEKAFKIWQKINSTKPNPSKEIAKKSSTQSKPSNVNRRVVSWDDI